MAAAEQLKPHAKEIFFGYLQQLDLTGSSIEDAWEDSVVPLFLEIITKGLELNEEELTDLMENREEELTYFFGMVIRRVCTYFWEKSRP